MVNIVFVAGLFQLFTVVTSQTCARGCLNLGQVFDVDLDGNADVNVPGWQFKVTQLNVAVPQSVLLSSAEARTNVTGLAFGVYEVCDSDPIESSVWFRTPEGRASCRSVNVTSSACVQLDFSRTCVGDPELATDDWSSDDFVDTLSQPDLDALSLLNLKTAYGNDFVAQNGAVYKSWIAPLGNAHQPVPLLTAADYGLIAYAEITNTGFTIINGDLGLHPGTSVTGFAPGIVNGAVHIADAAALQSKVDLSAAYGTAAALAPTVMITDDLGGQTLEPGVHKSTGSIEVTGTVYLDAMGDENAVFVMQASSTLTMAADSAVVLINGAQARNVFWKVGSSATLGADAALVGTVLAYTSISLGTGATVEGRLLASNGAITLQSNVVTVPPAIGALDAAKYRLSAALAVLVLNTRRGVSVDRYVRADGVMELLNTADVFQNLTTLIKLANDVLGDSVDVADVDLVGDTLTNLLSANTWVEDAACSFTFAAASSAANALASACPVTTGTTGVPPPPPPPSSTPCETACGDPHFIGLDGVKFEFVGRPNTNFALISDPTLQMNARFVTGTGHRTFMGSICLRACNDTLVVKMPTASMPGLMVLNGKGIAIGSTVVNGKFAVHRPHKHEVNVAFGARWQFTMKVGDHVDVDHATAGYAYGGKTHGIIGHTLKRTPDQTHACINGHFEGGCAVEGDWHDYIVPGNDLCSTEWTHAQFDADACAV